MFVYFCLLWAVWLVVLLFFTPIDKQRDSSMDGWLGGLLGGAIIAYTMFRIVVLLESAIILRSTANGSMIQTAGFPLVLVLGLSLVLGLVLIGWAWGRGSLKVYSLSHLFIRSAVPFAILVGALFWAVVMFAPGWFGFDSASAQSMMNTSHATWEVLWMAPWMILKVIWSIIWGILYLIGSIVVSILFMVLFIYFMQWACDF